MNSDTKVYLVMAGILGVWIGLVLFGVTRQSRECEQRGGALVRGAWWALECVAKVGAG